MNKTPEAKRFEIGLSFIGEDAKPWFRSNQDALANPRIVSWDDLKREMRKLHTNASWQGRKALHRLRQTGSVRKYVRQFQSLMMKIGNMAEEYKVFRFEVDSSTLNEE